MTAITTAARLLREAASELKNAHPLGGDWGNELEALDAYNEHMATATTLEHMGRQCLAQIEEPAQPVAEICSASHDDAQFGERAIKPLCDISGFEYGTQLYAGAAPAAVAPALDVTLDEDQAGLLRDMLGDPAEYEEALTVRLIVCDGHSGHGLYVAQAEYQDEGAVLLTALEAPAAPALDAKAIAVDVCQRVADMDDRSSPADWPEAMLVTGPELVEIVEGEIAQAMANAVAAPIMPTALHVAARYWQWLEIMGRLTSFSTFVNEFGYEKEDCKQVYEQVVLPCFALLAAAPQAPAAPWKDHLTARLVNDLRDCAIKYHGAGQLRDRIAHIVAPLCDQLKAAQAAPAAPAVDAWLQPDDMAALQRFHETAEDDESYDIGKEAVARLCAFGCLQSHSFGRYSTTDFGDYLLDTWGGARTLPFTTAAERRDRAAQAKEGGEAC
ncbi:hypothetical protein F3K36_25385 [Delftia sp. BR1]|nr:hypothetical protein F3K36_25385 [Delftia sp. BR1]